MSRNTVLILAIALSVLITGIYSSRMAGAQTKVTANAGRIIANQKQILQKLDHISQQLEVLKIRIH